MTLLPTSWLWPAAGVAAAVLVTALGVQTVRLAGAQRDVARVTAAWADDKAQAAAAARRAEAAARAEEQRRAAVQKEITDALESKLQQARADAVIADAAAGRLQQRVAALIAAARASARDPGPAGSSPPAGDADVVLADVLGRCVTRVRQLADLADQRGAAGSACERAFDALTP